MIYHFSPAVSSRYPKPLILEDIVDLRKFTADEFSQAPGIAVGAALQYRPSQSSILHSQSESLLPQVLLEMSVDTPDDL